MQNGIQDERPYVLPQTSGIDEDAVKQEKQRAKFAKSKEFQLLKDHVATRIQFYQSYLPDGRPVGTAVPTPEQWAIANGIIAELNLIIGSFEQVAESIDAA